MKITDRHYILDRNHPYLAAMDLTYYQVVPGHWRVRWRDFLMAKQDCDFSTEQEAREFRDEIWLNAHRIDRALLEDASTSFSEASAMWEALV